MEAQTTTHHKTAHHAKVDLVPHRQLLPDIHVSKSTMRRVGHVAAAVILIVAGVLVAVHLSPEIGAGLIASGVHQIVRSFTTEGEEDLMPISSRAQPRRHRNVHSGHPAMAL